MKRETRPFVVEVRRGSKKQNTPFLPTPPEAQQQDKTLLRAEEILFSRGRGPEDENPSRSGRILESVEEATPEPVVLIEPPQAARRRGRPPGSKNQPRQAETAGGPTDGPRRGRPRAGAEVRRLTLTPELVNAAIDSIARAAQGPGPAASGGARVDEPTAALERSRAYPNARFSAAGRGSEPIEAFELGEDDGEPHEGDDFLPAADDSAGRPTAVAADPRRIEVRRLLKPSERWRSRLVLRSLARRQRP